MSTYNTRKVAAPYTLEHRVYIEKDGVPVSAFHDIPLYANAEQTILNMVVEIPRWTNAKLEVSFLKELQPPDLIQWLGHVYGFATRPSLTCPEPFLIVSFVSILFDEAL